MDMNKNWLPKHWQGKTFNASDFNETVIITHGDGSCCIFMNAKLWVNNKHEEICVFTEHMGYHIFFKDPDIIYRTYSSCG